MSTSYSVGNRAQEDDEDDFSSDDSISSRNNISSLDSRSSSTPTPTSETISTNSEIPNNNSTYNNRHSTSLTESSDSSKSDCDIREGVVVDVHSIVTNPITNNRSLHHHLLYRGQVNVSAGGAQEEKPKHYSDNILSTKTSTELKKTCHLIPSLPAAEQDGKINKLKQQQRQAASKRKTKSFFLSPFYLYRSGLVRKMYQLSIRYHKEICLILFLVASGLPFLRSKPLKIRSVQTPGPFFDQPEYQSLVDDHYQGEYVDLVQKKIPKAPSFVFYYAPWDSESLAAKSVFLEVARHFRLSRGDQVKFYAVNCWWPDGQCRQNYKNLSHYPIFVAHIIGSAGIIYNGPIRAELMIRFLNLILQPVTRIDTEDELWRFRAQHDAVMLAFFNFTIPDSSAAFDIYRQMALRNLEADPLGQVGYGVFLLRTLAEKYFVTSSNAISLVLFNEIHTAKWHGGFQAQDVRAPVKQVADWVMERTRTTPITWAYRVRNGFSNRPVTLGPLDLAQELSNGPVLLLITRRYYPSGFSPFYAQVKEVALDYFNCNRSGNVTRLRRYTHKLNAEWLKLWKSIQRICASAKNPTFNCELMKEQLKNWKGSAEVLLKREPLAEFERSVSSSSPDSGLNFTGLSCKTKRPFRFIAIDPADIPYFIELALGGISPAASSFTNQEPLAFIIDAKNDLLIQIPSFKPSDIAKTIYNYTLSVQSFSEPGSKQSNNIYASRLWVEKIQKNTNQENDKEKGQRKIVIEKLNTEDLLQIMSEKKDNEGSLSLSTDEEELRNAPVFVMFTAQYCGYCGVVLTYFVSLARFLGDYGLKIRLARIDVFRNSLPAHLTVGEIPSFLLFPAYNRSDVRIFPPGKEINVKSLLQFLLSELDAKTRIQLSLKSPLCSSESDFDGEIESEPHPSSVSYLMGHGHRENGTITKITATSNVPSEPQQSGREYCQSRNKKLVTKSIDSVLRVLQSDLPSITSGKTDFNDRNSENAQSIYHLNNNDAKLYFENQLLNDDSSSSSAHHDNDSSNEHYYHHHDDGNKVKTKNFLPNNDDTAHLLGTDKSASFINFQSESIAIWSHQILDHLRSLHLFLDVM